MEVDLTQRREARGEELDMASVPLRALRLCAGLNGLRVAMEHEEAVQRQGREEGEVSHAAKAGTE